MVNERNRALESKSPARGRAFGRLILRCDQAPRALIRMARRDTFREAVFLWTMPFWAARMISGSADRRTCVAFAWSPPAIASSTLRRKVRIRLRRERLTSVRFAILRVIFLADVVLAIGKPSSNKDRPAVPRQVPIRWCIGKCRRTRDQGDGLANGRL